MTRKLNPFPMTPFHPIIRVILVKLSQHEFLRGYESREKLDYSRERILVFLCTCPATQLSRAKTPAEEEKKVWEGRGTSGGVPRREAKLYAVGGSPGPIFPSVSGRGERE